MITKDWTFLVLPNGEYVTTQKVGDADITFRVHERSVSSTTKPGQTIDYNGPYYEIVDELIELFAPASMLHLLSFSEKEQAWKYEAELDDSVFGSALILRKSYSDDLALTDELSDYERLIERLLKGETLRVGDTAWTVRRFAHLTE